jgi:hypothetical protein
MADVEFTIGAIDMASNAINGVRGAIFTMNQAMQLAQQVIRGVNQVIDQTVGAYVKYADQVRSLSQLTAQSAQSTSRLIQVTEDYRIEVGDLTAASKKLATEGLSMNVETIAKLSDEFLKLHTGSERQLFLTEHLGRASSQWTNILMQGSEAILARNKSVNQALILDEAALKKAQEYGMALDDVSDAAMALKISLGEYLLPVVINILNWVNKSIAGWNELFKYLNRNESVIDETIDQGARLQDMWEKDRAAMEDLMAILESGRAEWEQLYTGAEKAADQVKLNTDLMKGWLGELGQEGADVWSAYLVSTEAISPAAIEQFVKIQAAFIQVRNWLESGMSIPIIVNFLQYTLTGSGPNTRDTAVQQGKWRNIGIVGMGDEPNRSVWENSETGDRNIGGPGKAAGGYVSGRYAITGDSLSGKRTGYEELVDFQQKRVYSAPETQAMGAVPGYAMGSGAIDLSYQTIQDLANAVAQKMSGYV